MAKPALGRGLGALITPRIATPDPVEELGERIEKLPLDRIGPSPLQPRKEFKNDRLHELVESIRERGIIQPLIVRRVGDRYELIAGERRWRAACELALGEAPAIVRKADDREVLETALIENLQREDLNPVEEAEAYGRLHRDFSMTQEQIARSVAKSRASIANSLRLLTLPESVLDHLKGARLTVGHAKVLLSLKTAEEQGALADETVRRGLSVRALEKLTAEQAAAKPATGKGRRAPAGLAPAIQHIQNRLTHRLATRVQIAHGEKRGTISIEYYGADDLDRIASQLGLSGD